MAPVIPSAGQIVLFNVLLQRSAVGTITEDMDTHGQATSPQPRDALEQKSLSFFRSEAANAQQLERLGAFAK